MVRLSWCWIMVESIVIPHGFLKWFYLSFYIHPSFLALLQIFLWIRKLHACLLFLLVFVFKVSTFVITSTLRFFNCFCKKQSTLIINPNQLLLTTPTHGFKRRSVVNIYFCNENLPIQEEEEEEEEVYHLVLSSCSSNSPDMGYASGMNDQFLASPCSEEEEEQVYTDMGYADGMASPCSSSAAAEYDYDEILMPAALCYSNSPPAMGCGTTDIDHQHYRPQQLMSEEEEEIDPFYDAYLQKMKWFDVVNHDRFFAIKAMMNEKHLSENIAARRVSKSLEKELELVYVAQSCLSWEALHHQFTKAVAISSNPQNHQMLFHKSVAERFQKFQILLERFLERFEPQTQGPLSCPGRCWGGKSRDMHDLTVSASILIEVRPAASPGVFQPGNVTTRTRTRPRKNFSSYHRATFHLAYAPGAERFLEDERCGGTRHSNYVHRKYSLQTLLLVPPLSGYLMEDGKLLNEEGMKAIEVLKGIEKCITTFWLYVKEDTKRFGWRRPTLEDPRDLDLLLVLTKLLRKRALKEVERKRRCWLRRRAVDNQEVEASSENTELMCTRIDMKLVGRVLRLPIISTSHLQWCQHKLGNIDFNRDGNIIRAQYTSFLFPS